MSLVISASSSSGFASSSDFGRSCYQLARGIFKIAADRMLTPYQNQRETLRFRQLPKTHRELIDPLRNSAESLKHLFSQNPWQALMSGYRSAYRDGVHQARRSDRVSHWPAAGRCCIAILREPAAICAGQIPAGCSALSTQRSIPPERARPRTLVQRRRPCPPDLPHAVVSPFLLSGECASRQPITNQSSNCFRAKSGPKPSPVP
jgi:hypothetical protein